MAGFDDLVGKARDAASDPKLKEHLQGKQAEDISDGALDQGEKLAGGMTGGKHDEQIDELREQADRRIGNE
jgi:hypothetical protein